MSTRENSSENSTEDKKLFDVIHLERDAYIDHDYFMLLFYDYKKRDSYIYRFRNNNKWIYSDTTLMAKSLDMEYDELKSLFEQAGAKYKRGLDFYFDTEEQSRLAIEYLTQHLPNLEVVAPENRCKYCDKVLRTEIDFSLVQIPTADNSFVEGVQLVKKCQQCKGIIESATVRKLL